MEVREVIEAIRERGVDLSVKRGKSGKIIPRPPDQVTPEEREFIAGHRAEVIEYLNSQSSAPAPEPESLESACCMRARAEGRAEGYEAGHAVGYGEGIQHAVAELQVNPQPAAPAPPRLPVLTPEGEVAKFKMWQHDRSGYYHWEPSCMDALRAALQPGDRLRPVYAYTVVIIHADGSEEEFERKPPRK